MIEILLQLSLSLYHCGIHMMSLLIVNQKVLYLVLLITLLYRLTSANQNITIYVQPNGTDKSECIEGNESIPCHTLSYVLNQINNTNNDVFNGTNISVYITYYQEMTNLHNIQLLFNLYLIGVDNPVLDFSINYITNSLLIRGEGSFYAENITFYDISGDFCNVTVSFNKCIFTSRYRGNDIYSNFLIWDVQNLTISNCLFYNNLFSLTITISNISNMKISGSELYQNIASLDISDCHTVTISNCLFHNNDDYLSLRISNVANMQISGCEFYENKGQDSLIDISLGEDSHFDMDNCSIFDNDVKATTFQLTCSHSESIITISNCLFLNNILEIMSERLYTSNINLINNKMKYTESSIMRITSCSYHSQNLILSNIKLINNTGTALKLENATVYFNNIIFYNNTGVYGGGMSLHYAIIHLTGPLRFERNKAIIGGAIYIATPDIYVAHCTRFEQIIFSSNFASKLGADVFIVDGFSVSHIIYFTFPCFDKTKTNHVRGDHITSAPYNIIINPQSNSMITLFPGQKLTYSTNVTDYFGNLTSCFTNMFLQCGNTFCEHVQLTGDAPLLLSTSNFTTNLYLTSNVEHHDYSIKLQFLCLDTNTEAYANVNLTTCPLGYVFQTSQNSVQGTCECVDIASNDVQCDFVLGVACIRHGLWFGEINEINELNNTVNDTAPCQYPYCKTDLSFCPISGLSVTYKKLPVAQDEQCNGLYSGLLCRSCRRDAVFSFEAVKCIPSSNCEPWQPYVTSVLAVVFQLVLGFGIVIGLKASFKTGIGHLYGPLFFIAVLRLIPFGYYKEYYQLKFIVSIFQSVLLLNLEIFGEISWCFFSNINPLLNYSLHFVGPFIIAVVLLSTVLLARYYPRQFLSLQSSPVQAICLLILLSFWSVSDTCIQLLKPTTTLSGWRVALQPNIQYLKDPYHIVTWIISTFLLMLLLVPFILLLFLSPLLRRKFNLTRIQPLLDAFQSCYDDKFRWYSGVYLLSWIILNINMPYYAMEIILIAVGTLHFMIQPYKYRWLNIVDTLLLVDLNMLAFLTSVDSLNGIHKDTVSISYILVVLPLTYITIGGVWIIIVIIIKWCKSKMSSTNAEEVVNLLNEKIEEVVDSGDRDIHIEVSSTVLEHPVCRRESLIFDDN